MRSPMPIGLLSTGLALLVIGSQAPVRAQDSLSLIDSLSRAYQTTPPPAESTGAPDAEAPNTADIEAPQAQAQTDDTSELGEPCPPCPCGDGSADTNSAPIFKNDTNNFPGLPKDTGMIPDSQIQPPPVPDTATPQVPNSIPPDTLR